MLNSVQKAFKVKEVRERLLYTFMMLIVIRIGSCLPIPGVDASFLKEFFTNLQNSGMGFVNAITGGSFSNMSLFALSITPYITSSIIMQLMTIAIPKLEERQKEGRRWKKEDRRVYQISDCGAGPVPVLSHGHWFRKAGPSL